MSLKYFHGQYSQIQETKRFKDNVLKDFWDLIKNPSLN